MVCIFSEIYMTAMANERPGVDAGWRILSAFEGARPRATQADCLVQNMSLRAFQQIAVAALVSGCLNTHAAEWSSSDAGVSFTLPNDRAWQQVKPPRNEAKLVLQNKKGRATVFFAAFEKKHDEKELNEKLAEGWEKGYFRKGNATKLSSQFLDFKGKHAYKVTDEEVIDSTKVRSVAIVWLNDGKLCDIVASKDDADPMQDEVIKAFINSMRFVREAAP